MRGESWGRKEPIALSLPPSDDDAAFRDKLARFDRADQAFRALVDKLLAYRKSLLLVLDCGVDLAQHIELFFHPPATAAQRELAIKFRQAQQSLDDKWKNHCEKRYEEDVYAPVKSRLNEIPEVRDFIKRRAAALADLRKKQKRLQQVSTSRNDNKVRERQRKVEESSVQFRTLHDEVIQRCTNIERNLGNFISPSLRDLISVCADFARANSSSLSEVENMLNSQPPMTPTLQKDDERLRQSAFIGLANANVGNVATEYWGDISLADTMDNSLPNDSRVKAYEDAVPATQNGGALQPFSDAQVESSLPPTNGKVLSSTLENLSPENNRTSAGTSQTSSTSAGRVGSDMSRLVLATISNGVPVGGRRNKSDDTFETETNDAQSQHSVAHDVLARRVAQFDFNPVEANELKIRKNDVIEVLAKNPSGWWKGRCNRHTGLFPENYTRPMTEEEETLYVERKAKRKNRSHRYGHRPPREKPRDSRSIRSLRSNSLASLTQL